MKIWASRTAAKWPAGSMQKKTREAAWQRLFFLFGRTINICMLRSSSSIIGGSWPDILRLTTVVKHSSHIFSWLLPWIRSVWLTSLIFRDTINGFEIIIICSSCFINRGAHWAALPKISHDIGTWVRHVRRHSVSMISQSNRSCNCLRAIAKNLSSVWEKNILNVALKLNNIFAQSASSSGCNAMFRCFIVICLNRILS